MTQLRTALRVLIVFSVITGILYPLAVTAIAQLLFPRQANGSLIEHNGRIVGSHLIGQQFTSPRYFWPRPSATTPAAYNTAASSGSNYGPLNPELKKLVEERVGALQSADPENTRPVPVDLVTASASGLDPHISPAAAMYQASRVARHRNMPVSAVVEIIVRHTSQRALGFLGEPVVNVLELNLALDGQAR